MLTSYLFEDTNSYQERWRDRPNETRQQSAKAENVLIPTVFSER